jgi:hypothetical protein
MSNDIVIRPATDKDARSYNGKRPLYSFRGFVAEKDGEVLGMCGIYFQAGVPIAFSDLRPELRAHKKILAKGCRIVQRLIEELGRPVYAVACDKEPTAPYLLAKLGFRPTGVFGPYGETLVRD